MKLFLKKEIKIYLKKNELEIFMNEIIKREIYILSIKEVKGKKYKISIMADQLELIKAVATDNNLSIQFQLIDSPSLFVSLIKKYLPLFSAIFISILFLFFLSKLIWEIEIVGVSNDLEIKLKNELEKEGVRTFQYYDKVQDTIFLQEKILENIPELLWVGIERKGVKYYVQGVEKEEKNNLRENNLKHLIAKKNGIIQKIDISKGFPKVNINDYVTSGTKLVSGIFEEDEESDNTSKNNAKRKIVGAEGKVYARTWYKMKLVIPLVQQFEELTGKTEIKYYGKIADFKTPIWNINKSHFTNVEEDESTHQLRIFNIHFPISIIKLTLKEKETITSHLTKEEAKELAIQFVKSNISLQIGPDAKVISEKVLHESIENGKVNLHLFITVEEDIAESEPIT